MWQDLWPNLPVWEVPITSVTNGVHLPSWLNGDLAALYDQYLQPDWRDRYLDLNTWELIDDIPVQSCGMSIAGANACWSISFGSTPKPAPRNGAPPQPKSGGCPKFSIPTRLPSALPAASPTTSGHADLARSRETAPHSDEPADAGADRHRRQGASRDDHGKSLIREVIQLSRDPEISKRLVFVEDYGIEVARELVQGVDLWLNNPRRGEEACGTSGMKAAINGVLNLSTLDGWYDEAYEISGGWAIGDREPYSEDQDVVHASAIYSILENEIVPLFYERDEAVPEEWMRRVKTSLRNISPYFNCLRMVRDYAEQFYEPATAAYRAIRHDAFASVRERARWNSDVAKKWDQVSFVEVGPPLRDVFSGSPIPISAVVELGGLSPDDVRVEAIIGRIDAVGHLKETEVLTLPPNEHRGTVAVFAKEFVPQLTGRLGLSIRISPNHYDDPLTRSCHSLLKWM